MSGIDELSDDWIKEAIRGSARNAALKEEAELSEFERAVLALRRISSREERARALYEAEIADRCEVCEQNEAEARAAGYPNLISMQAEADKCPF